MVSTLQSNLSKAVLLVVAVCGQVAHGQSEGELVVPGDVRPRVAESSGTVISPDGETLADAWFTALRVDPDLEASRWQSSAAQRGLYAARAERLPSVTAQGSYSVFDNSLSINAPVPPIPAVLPTGATANVTVNQREFFLGGVRVRQPLYTFGRITSAIDAAGAEVNAAVADEQRTELDVKLQVADAYVGVLRAQRLLEVAVSGVRSLQAHEREVSNLVDQGVGIRANLLAVQVALASARQLRLQMENLLTVAKSALNRSLQRPLDAPVEIQDLTQPTESYELEWALGEAMRQRPEIGFLSAKVRALRSQAAVVRAAKRPQVVLDGGFSYIENRFLEHETFNNVAVLAEWNFLDLGRTRHRVAQVEQSAESLLRKRSHIESLIALQVKKSWHDLDSAQQQVAVNQKALTSADENLRVSRNRYQQGAGTNTEVLDAQTLRTDAYSSYYSSLYETVLAEMRLLRAMGTL